MMNTLVKLCCASFKDSLLKNSLRTGKIQYFNKKHILFGYSIENKWTLRKYVHTTLKTSNLEPVNEGGDYSTYSGDEKSKIIKILNESGAEKLARYSISKMKIKRLLDWRKTKGEFHSFDDLLNVEGLGTKALQKMCDSMLDTSDTERNENKGFMKLRGQILEPSLIDLRKNKIKSVCSLSVDLTHTSWAHIERVGNLVSSWDIYNYNQIQAKQLKLSNIMDIVWEICQNIPRSDVYVMEGIPTVHRASGADANNPKAIHINLQKVQLIAMVSAALNSLENVMSADLKGSKGFTENFVLPPYEHHLFFLRPLLSSRLFKTYVGKESVSPQSIVDIMMSGNTNKENEVAQSLYDEVLKNIMPVRFSSDVAQSYSKRGLRDKEYLSQTLLLAITFMELCVCENINALKNFGNRNN